MLIWQPCEAPHTGRLGGFPLPENLLICPTQRNSEL
jgi:hypothetical protein